MFSTFFTVIKNFSILFGVDPRYASEFFQLFDIILRLLAACLQIFTHIFKMVRKSKELSHDRKQIVVDLKQEGCRNCEIVELLHIPESTVCSIWKKYNATSNVEIILRVGRPKKVTKPGEVRLLRMVKKNRGKVLRKITNDFNEGGSVRVPAKTVQRYLHKNKIFRCIIRKNVVWEVNKKKRLSWCLE
jgi:transposase